MSVSEDYMLDRIRPGDEKRSLVGLFKVLGVLERVYPEPKLQWVAYAGMGRLQVHDLTEEESAIAEGLMRDNKAAQEDDPKFYGEVVGFRINAL